MVECYSGLYEEGEVEHINDPTHPRLAIDMPSLHNAQLKNSLSKAKVGTRAPAFILKLTPPQGGATYRILLQINSIIRKLGHTPLICSTSPSSYNPE